jgi:hypothetical protein
MAADVGGSYMDGWIMIMIVYLFIHVGVLLLLLLLLFFAMWGSSSLRLMKLLKY